MKTFLFVLLFGSVSLACTSAMDCGMGESCVKWQGATVFDQGICKNTGTNKRGEKNEVTIIKSCDTNFDCQVGFRCTTQFGNGSCVKNDY